MTSGKPSTALRRAEPLLRRNMPELDSIRGLAILAVIFYHGFYWNLDVTRFSAPIRLALTVMWAGRLGVNLFFVLSGFLITGILADSKERANYYTRFYYRRALRIVPAYLATIAALIVLAYPWKFIALSVLYLSNLTPLFGVPIAYPVLWSLAVEEHFYFLWPLLIRRFTKRHMIVFCAVIVGLSPLARLLTFHVTEHSGFVSFVCNEYTWNSADGLALGAALALWLRIADPMRSRVKRAMSVIAATALLMMAVIPSAMWTRQKPLGAALQVVPWHLLFVAMVGAFLLAGTSEWRNYVNIPILRFYGYISYGLYLYHLLIFYAVDALGGRGLQRIINTYSVHGLVMRFAVTLTLATGISFVSRRYFEDGFLKLKTKLASE